MSAKNAFGDLRPRGRVTLFLSPPTHPYQATMSYAVDGVQHNWAGTLGWKPESVAEPKTLEELVEVVQRAEADGLRARAVGRLHSWSPSAITDGVMIDTTHLSRVLSLDKEKKQVKVEGGMTLRDLYVYIDEQKLALESLPNTDDISVAGAMSTGTHGTNVVVGSFASLVTEVQVVSGAGRVLTLRKDATDAKEREQFNAAIVAWGNIGILYSVTVQLVDTYSMVVVRETMNYKDLDGKIPSMAPDYDSIQFMVFPQPPMVFVKTQTKIKTTLYQPAAASWWSNRSFEFIIWVFRPKGYKILAAAVRWLMGFDFFFDLIRPGYKDMTITNWSGGELSNHGPRFTNMEYAIPLDRIHEVIDAIFALDKSYREAGKYSRCLPLILRPVGTDSDGYMSMTRGRKTCFVDMLFQAFSDDEMEFYKECETIFLAHEGRVSWSRKFFQRGHAVLDAYPDHGKFLKVIKDVDPKGTFSNDFAKEIFADCDAAGCAAKA